MIEWLIECRSVAFYVDSVARDGIYKFCDGNMRQNLQLFLFSTYKLLLNAQLCLLKIILGDGASM